MDCQMAIRSWSSGLEFLARLALITRETVSLFGLGDRLSRM